MDSISARILLQKQANELNAELRAMAQEYSEYKSRKDAYPAVLKKMERRILLITEFLDQAKETFRLIDEERSADYKDGFREGRYEVTRTKDFHLRRDGWIQYTLHEIMKR